MGARERQLMSDYHRVFTSSLLCSLSLSLSLSLSPSLSLELNSPRKVIFCQFLTVTLDSLGESWKHFSAIFWRQHSLYFSPVQPLVFAAVSCCSSYLAAAAAAAALVSVAVAAALVSVAVAAALVSVAAAAAGDPGGRGDDPEDEAGDAVDEEDEDDDAEGSFGFSTLMTSGSVCVLELPLASDF